LGCGFLGIGRGFVGLRGIWRGLGGEGFCTGSGLAGQPVSELAEFVRILERLWGCLKSCQVSGFGGSGVCHLFCVVYGDIFICVEFMGNSVV